MIWWIILWLLPTVRYIWMSLVLPVDTSFFVTADLLLLLLLLLWPGFWNSISSDNSVILSFMSPNLLSMSARDCAQCQQKWNFYIFPTLSAVVIRDWIWWVFNHPGLRSVYVFELNNMKIVTDRSIQRKRMLKTMRTDRLSYAFAWMLFSLNINCACLYASEIAHAHTHACGLERINYINRIGNYDNACDAIICCFILDTHTI